jgi:nitrile hydratase accessory protein
MTISSAPDIAGRFEAEGAPVFAEPWQAQAFALTVELHRGGAFTWSEWSAALGARIGTGGGAPYYEDWLAALETILAEKGLADAAQLAALKSAWAHAYRDTPHGKPVTPPTPPRPAG